MATTTINNPYKAGFGIHPPYFAGRQEEIEMIVDTLDMIKGGAGQMEESPNSALVLIGPRGVGKTVLLGLAMNEAQSRRIHTTKIDNELLSGAQAELVSHMFPEGILKKVFGKVGNIKLSYLDAGVVIGLKDAEKKFRSAVPAFLTKKPLLIVLDEAHKCSPEDLNLLFGISQSCMLAKMPLSVIIAGTPGLAPLLQRCNATYIERSKHLRFNTLTETESREALEIPAKKSGKPMKPAALKLLLEWSDRYPYFIQLVGEHSWAASRKRGGSEITVADATLGITKADNQRKIFYKDRYWELGKRDLEDCAFQSTMIIRGHKGGGVDPLELAKLLMKMNNGMDKQSAMRVVEELQEVGYLWDSNDQMEPGIPSMFDFVIGKQRAT